MKRRGLSARTRRALHGECCERDHWNGVRRLVPLEQRSGGQAVHAGKLNIHQDQVGALFSCERQPGLRIRSGEHTVARVLQQEYRKLHIGGVVLDD
jgi:hypothetical protein